MYYTTVHAISPVYKGPQFLKAKKGHLYTRKYSSFRGR